MARKTFDQLGIVDGLIVSDHHQWHPPICEVYKRVRGHKVRQESPADVTQWLFPFIVAPR